MNRRLDVLFVTPDASAAIYQALSQKYAAIEPPTWSLLLAQSCRAKGFGVAILDCIAEHLDHASAALRIRDMNPRLVVLVLYGQNPNSGTTCMIGAKALAATLKAAAPDLPICCVGSHVSALPKEVLALEGVDLVLLNEGVYALHDLLASDLEEDLAKIRGIGRKVEGRPVLNPPQQVVPHDRMDVDLPGYAWDLLPYRARPLDLYRSHVWHAGYNESLRSPFAAIYTSLGCRFKCEFCMINILNRVDNGDHISSADSAHMRFWSPEFVLRTFDELAAMGVETIRLCDEMFFLDQRYFQPILEGLVDRGHTVRSWSYARVDTVRPKYLELFRKAGIGWLGLGIESANQVIRKEVSKGSFQNVNVRDVVREIQEAGINVGANYIFGLPEDTLDTLQETLALALELNTEFANMYTCMPLPGSPLYQLSLRNGWALPSSYDAYAFLGYDCEPMPTNHLRPEAVLRFRDEAWHTYFSHPPYLDLVERRFGKAQRENVEAMATIRLKRRLLGD